MTPDPSVSNEAAVGAGSHITGSPAPANALPEPWTTKRILTLLALGTLIVSVIWRAPGEAGYISERAGEIFVTLVLAMTLTYLLRPLVNTLHRTKTFGAGSRSGRAWATVVVFLFFVLLMVAFCMIGLRPITQNVRNLWDTWFVAYTDSDRHALILRWQETLQNQKIYLQQIKLDAHFAYPSNYQ